MIEAIQSAQISAVILAGGQGSRMGGVDKGLQTLAGQTLVQHALTRLRGGGGVGHIMINANRHLHDYAQYGVPVWPDTLSDYQGPLAGFLVGLAHCPTPYLLTVPCDTPMFPLDVAQRLSAALHEQHADIAMAAAVDREADRTQRLIQQPVFCLLRLSLLPSLQTFVQEGGRKIGAWAAQHKTVLHAFDRPSDGPRAFFNANTLADLAELASS